MNVKNIDKVIAVIGENITLEEARKNRQLDRLLKSNL